MEPPGSRSHLATFALISLLTLGAAACGASGSDTTALSGADTSTTSEVATTTTDPGSSTTIPPTTATSTAASASTTTGASDVARQEFQLRPVLAVERCRAIAGRETDPGEDVLTEDDHGKGDDAVCYLVGPAGADGTDIATAEAASDGAGQWLVSVTVAETSRDRLNAMFNACYQGELTCPGTTGPGAVAIVVGGTVSSAPAVQAENLANDPFSISGDFTKTEAEQLARALNG